MTSTTRMTEKQRQAMEAQEAARVAGVTLAAYAQGKGLAIRELYDALACLRRKGVLPKPAGQSAKRFVAVRVQTGSDRAAVIGGNGAMVCRVVRRDGTLIECAQWPSPGWVSALGSTDAAS